MTAEEAAAAKARHARMEAARKLKEEADAKKNKAKKEKPAERSLLVFEVKPWEAETDLVACFHDIVKFEKEGLTWGENYKIEPMAFGVNKLIITATIVDSLILVDDLTEHIESLEDYVQSVELASMNKL